MQFCTARPCRTTILHTCTTSLLEYIGFLTLKLYNTSLRRNETNPNRSGNRRGRLPLDWIGLDCDWNPHQSSERHTGYAMLCFASDASDIPHILKEATRQAGSNWLDHWRQETLSWIWTMNMQWPQHPYGVLYYLIWRREHSPGRGLVAQAGYEEAHASSIIGVLHCTS